MATRRQFHFHGGKAGAAIAVRVTPRASRNEITQILEDGTIKIRITAPPVEGKANEALLRYLAEVLDISPSSLEIVAGQSGRDKWISILGLDSAMVQERIKQALQPANKMRPQEEQ